MCSLDVSHDRPISIIEEELIRGKILVGCTQLIFTSNISGSR